MTTNPSSLEVEAGAFARVLVPYDGSAQSETALGYGIALAQRGSALDILHVVDETPVVTESAAALADFDTVSLLEAFEAQGRALIAATQARCRAAGVDARTQLIRGFPVSGIDRTAAENKNDLIVLGTHGRGGLPRTFLGSTTEGVLRSSSTPVLAVHADMGLPTRLFAKILVAVDDSEPADAAVAMAARIARSSDARVVVCNAYDVDAILNQAGTYGYDPVPLVDGARDSAKDVVDRALAHGGFSAGAATSSTIEDEPSHGIVAEAVRTGAELIVVGSHGRRGLRRLFLGSVAEHVVRHSPVPVLVVRS